LLIYVALGGARADILTDGVQGFIMVAVRLLVMGLFLMGYGIDGGFSGMLGLGGILARVILGEGVSGNQALALLFIELFPSWLAALLGVGILAAVMSTADGLVVSSSQIVANDLYRLTFAPRFRANLSEQELERRVLNISRVSTVVIMMLCTAMAWAMLDMNVTIIVWIGTGCMMAAFAGPLILGAVWKGVTKAGAFAGLISGGLVFIVVFNRMIDPQWFPPGTLQNAAIWLNIEAPNPWSCAAMGELFSLAVTVIVSKLTQPLPEAHMLRLFPAQPAPES